MSRDVATARRPRVRVLALAVCVGLALLSGGTQASPAPAAGDGPGARIVVDPGSRQGPISPLLFGANHRYGYEAFGMYDVDAGRVFPKFVRQSRSAGLSTIRFPGGTIANPYHWQRAIGPESQRTRNLEGDLRDPEPLRNDFGPDEYGRYLEQLGARGTIVVNFATGDAREAADWVEYMTSPLGTNPNGGTAWARVRADNGHPKPYDIPYWEVGNEMFLGGQRYWMNGATDRECQTVTYACLYAFGGSTRFTRQRAVGYANWRDSAAVSDGSAAQRFYVNFPSVEPGSQTVFVDGEAWREVDDLDAAGGEDVYAFDPADGRISFGDGEHGNVPADGNVVTVSYTSGPHDGFVDFYREMAKVNPDIKVCSSVLESFMQVMGSEHPYDCVAKHTYVGNPGGADQPPDQYHSRLMLNADDQGREVAAVQQKLEQYAGARADDVEVVVTEYGQFRGSGPNGTDFYMQSLDQGLHVANLLRNWIDLGIGLADAQALVDYVFGPSPSGQPVATGVRVLISGPGPDSVPQGAAHVFELFTAMTGDTHVRSAVLGNPHRTLPGGRRLPALRTVASTDAAGNLYLVVINQDPEEDVRATVLPQEYRQRGSAEVWTVDAPSYLSYNTPEDPDVVSLSKEKVAVSAHAFGHTFPAHSVTALKLTGERVDSPVDLALETPTQVAPGGSTDVVATVRNTGGDAAAGELELQPPDGWTVEPASARYEVAAHSTRQQTFALTAPPDARVGSYDVRAVLRGPGPFVADTAATGVDVRIDWEPAFEDIFDDQPLGSRPDGYALSGPDGAVTVRPAPERPGNALRVRRDDPDTGYLEAVRSFEPVRGTVRFVTRVRASQASGAALGVHLLDADRRAVAKLSLTGDGEVAYTDGGSFRRDGAYAADRWYTLKVVADQREGRYRLFLDDQRIAGGALNGAAGPLSRIRLQIPAAPEGTGTFFADDLSISIPDRE